MQNWAIPLQSDIMTLLSLKIEKQDIIWKITTNFHLVFVWNIVMDKNNWKKVVKMEWNKNAENKIIRCGKEEGVIVLQTTKFPENIHFKALTKKKKPKEVTQTWLFLTCSYLFGI